MEEHRLESSQTLSETICKVEGNETGFWKFGERTIAWNISGIKGKVRWFFYIVE